MVKKEDQPHNPGTRQHADPTELRVTQKTLSEQSSPPTPSKFSAADPLRTAFLGQTWQRALQERQHLTATVILQAIIICFLVQTTTLQQHLDISYSLLKAGVNFTAL